MFYPILSNIVAMLEYVNEKINLCLKDTGLNIEIVKLLHLRIYIETYKGHNIIPLNI